MKISVIGAGNVGATACFLLIAKEICSNVVLLDINKNMARGKAIDMMQASIALISKTKIKTTNDYCDIDGSGIVVITAGLPRKDDMSREELLGVNIKIMEDIIRNVKKFAPNAILIVVSNPLDSMNYAAFHLSGFDKKKVIGMGGILDSARMAHAIVNRMKDKHDIVQAMVIGSHSEYMVPLISQSFIGKKNISEVLSSEEIEEIMEKTKKGGARIVNFLQTSAYYAPAASICILIESILKDKKITLPCSAILDGEYGESGVSIGVPVVIGKNGIERIVELNLNKDERRKFKESVDYLRQSLKIVDKYIKNI